jgi:predicted amidohydrolase
MIPNLKMTEEVQGMKIGFFQFSPALENLESTLEKIAPYENKFRNMDLLVLPELCNSGYNFTTADQAWRTSEKVDRSEFVSYLLDLCTRHQFYVVTGFNERDSGKLYNTALLIGPDGVVGKYRKLHLFKNEKDFFEPGNLGLPVFDIGGIKVGLLVCFDWIFPEVWRVLALKGAQVICHPSNLVLPGLAQKAVPVHALMNRIYVVTANRIGTEDNLTFTGLSTIADPKGEILIQASETEETLETVTVDISAANDKLITPRNDIFADRRPSLYTDLLLQAGD